MLTFKELKTEAARLVQRSGDLTYTNNIVGFYINMGQEFLANAYDYYTELKNEYNFTTVDGTALYYMPNDFDKPFRFYDITNNKKINIRTQEQYFDGNIANIADANEADANTAYFTEVVGVKRQVATTGDTLQAKSSVAGDSPTVRVEAYLDSGLSIIGYVDIAVNGTTPVTNATTVYKILGVSKSTDTSGYITLEDSSGNDLAVLDSIARVSRYKAFRLGRIPDDSTTSMRVLYKKRIRKLVNDNDYPFIDADEYFITNAAGYALANEKETVDRAQIMWGKSDKMFNVLMLNVQGQLGPDYQHRVISPLMDSHRS